MKAKSGCRWAASRSLKAAGSVLTLTMLCAVGPAAWAEDATSDADLKQIVEELEAQKATLKAQQDALAEQQRVIANQQNQLNFLKAQMGVSDDPDVMSVSYNLGGALPSGDNSGIYPAQDSTGESTGQEPVGEAPEEERPEISIAESAGGVLTRKGQMVVEPSISYQHSDQNTFFFQGFPVADTVFIGLLEASEADRDTITAALTTRYGITNRLEAEVRVPFVYRDDTVENTVVTSGATFTEKADAHNLGDVEAAVHYQVTDGPIYTVANLRVKTPTGIGPFEVDSGADGAPAELPTGTGFWAVQPSITAIFPIDPLVFFGSIGYTINIGEDVGVARAFVGADNIFGTADDTVVAVDDVNPGDSINLSFGMGLSLNERTSMSLGFEYNQVFGTEQDVRQFTGGALTSVNNFESDTLHVASFLVGWSYQVSDDVGLNLNFGVGATEDAQDFKAEIRVPIRFSLFN